MHYALNTTKASNLRRANRHAPGVHRAMYRASGEIQKGVDFFVIQEQSRRVVSSTTLTLLC